MNKTFGNAQFGAPAARVEFDFRFGRQDRLFGHSLQCRMMAARAGGRAKISAGPRIQVANAVTRLTLDKLLDNPILKRMKSDDPAPG